MTLREFKNLNGNNVTCACIVPVGGAKMGPLELMANLMGNPVAQH